MTRARKQLISIEDTPYYHIVSRAVRRAFLCGDDPLTGQSFEHRRQWVVDRLAVLEQIYCIDICAYSVMSNHFHLVLYINQQAAIELSDQEVIERWCELYNGSLAANKARAGKALSLTEQALLQQDVQKWRERLANISWFMRGLNEHIARKANREDQCTGHFWESRFKSQALLDEQALLTCMTYVDLNPIRANVAKTPESSDYTSIQSRLNPSKTATVPNLKAFDPSSHEVSSNELVYALEDYCQLVDVTGRIVREDKKGFINASESPILSRLNITTEQWLEMMQPHRIHVSCVLGTKEHLENYVAHHELHHLKGQRTQANWFT